MNGPNFKLRIASVFIFFSMVFGAVLFRAGYLQLKGDERLSRLERKQFNSKILVSAQRGLILDRNNEPLAINTESMSLAANPKKVKDKQTTSNLLAQLLGIPKTKLLDRFKENREFVWLKRKLSDQQLEQLKQTGLLDSRGRSLPGLWLVKESHRYYPHGELASHVLGSVNIDNEGKEGIERVFEKRLAGKLVSLSAVKDALGRPAFYDPTVAGGAKDGESVKLTIDASLQYAVEQSLAKSIEKTGARSGTVIVMDAENGDLLSVANYPTYNPNFGTQDQSARRNRAFTDGYEPGSTMKAILLAGAFESGMQLDTKIHGEYGSIQIQGRVISESESHEKFEWLSLKEMLAVSSNVISAKLALKLGRVKLSELYSRFGMQLRTQTGFPGEISGFMPNSKKPWQPLTIATLGFGQGLLVTPIQMVRAYAVFVNGGRRVEPRITLDPNQNGEASGVQIMDPKIAAKVTEALLGVTASGGTGIKAVPDGYLIAGKTGTAQTVDPNLKKYSKTRYIPTFIGFPVKTNRKIVAFTMLDEPMGVYYASETAAPLFKEVMAAVTRRFAIPATENFEVKSEPVTLATVTPKEVRVEQPPKIEEVVSSEGSQKMLKIPNFRGLTLAEAMESLRGSPLKVKAQGVGLVVAQFPDASTEVTPGSLIELRLGEKKDLQ